MSEIDRQINPTGAPVEVTIILPHRGYRTLALGMMWRARELVVLLASRDVKIRYKQTILGGLWAIIHPIVTMIVFTILFGRMAGLPSDGSPYPIFVFAGILPWQLFASALSQSSNSLVANQNLFTKVYFPRLLLPISSLVVAMVDFALALLVLIALMAWYGVMPTWAVLTLPIWLLLALASALAAGLWFSALNALYRDVVHVVPFITQLLFFLTPVVYSSSLVSDKWKLVYGLNPMAGVVEGFRWALLPSAPAPGALVAVSACVVVVALVTGLLFFARMEDTFADVV